MTTSTASDFGQARLQSVGSSRLGWKDLVFGGLLAGGSWWAPGRLGP